MPDLIFRALTIGDLFAVEAQPSQRIQIGLSAEMTDEIAETLVAQPVAWTVFRAGWPIACFGIAEQFPGVGGLGWSILTAGIGTDLIKITRFCRYEIEHCGLARVELLAIGPNVEPMLARIAKPLDPGQLLALALLAPTPQMRWAALLGVEPAHVMRCYGGLSETYLLYERITPPAIASLSLVEASK